MSVETGLCPGFVTLRIDECRRFLAVRDVRLLFGQSPDLPGSVNVTANGGEAFGRRTIVHTNTYR